ncbi:MAG: hypothetical protein WED11_05260 [Natronospirillum sp.]
MNKVAIMSLCLFGAMPMMATAQTTQTNTQRMTTLSGFGPVAGDQELTLSGSGGMSEDFDNFSFSGDADWGWYLQDSLLVGVRQNVSYVNIPDTELTDDFWQGSSRAYADWVFNMDALRPFVGASLGYIYGDAIEDSVFVGLEGGSKIYVQEKTFINARAEYQWSFADADDLDEGVEDAFENSAVALALGVGYNF